MSIMCCREYFIDAGGHLSIEARVKILRDCGHRRCSIDLSSFLCRQVISSTSHHIILKPGSMTTL